MVLMRWGCFILDYNTRGASGNGVAVVVFTRLQIFLLNCICFLYNGENLGGWFQAFVVP